ncbi:MAG TPA: hypothetical protein VMM76_20160 [Pirellulaceae bacterium]|nr:hypothetical protein [Pirellulaceae bacterium]
MSEQDHERLYDLYCVYLERVNAGVSGQRFRVAALQPATYPDFLAIWNSISERQRQLWRLRFETGYEVVAEAQHRRLVAAFTANAMLAMSVRYVRAA